MLSLKYLCDIHVEILSYWIVWTICIFWKLSPCCLYHLQIFFSQSIGCSFILFVVFFTVWKFLGLIRSHLFIFALIFIVLGDWPKKILLWFMSQNISPMFSPTSFRASYWVLHLAILSLILCMVWGSVLPSLIHRQLSSFYNTAWRDSLFPNVYLAFVED